MLDGLPLWSVLAIALAGLLLAGEAGFRLGGWRRAQARHEREPPVGGMVAAELGLLALLLAFTFGVAAARFETRRLVLLDEANAVGTTYLRAAMLEPSAGAEARRLLRTYVDVRLAAVQEGAVEVALRRSAEVHAGLWSIATAEAARAPQSLPVALFVQAVNAVIDLHGARTLAAFHGRIPSAIWTVLGAVAALSFVSMGYQAGLAGSTRSPAALTVALGFAAVFWVLVDLDRPTEGNLRVSQQPMLELRASMGEPDPAASASPPARP